MDTQNIQAVYLPVSYEPNTGSLELQSLQEGFKIMGVEEGDITPLPLPKATIYMAKSLQRLRAPEQRNKGASLVVRDAGIPSLEIWGPVLVVKGENRQAPVPDPVFVAPSVKGGRKRSKRS